MRFQGALIKEQGVTFGIVVVKPHVLQSESDGSKFSRDTDLLRKTRYC